MTEITEVHTRILRYALAVPDARAYWAVPDIGPAAGRADRAAAEFWFGARSHARVELILANLRLRFDAEALAVLRAWPDMDPATRTVICHWHLQLADPLYRAFTGEYLVNCRAEARDVTLAKAVAWVGEQDGGRWTARSWAMSTRMKFASKLLSAATEAGLVGSTRDPRPLTLPRVPPDALGYALHLLRGIDGSLLDNPYLASVGVSGVSSGALPTVPGVRFARQGSLIDLEWQHDSLASWSAARRGSE